MTAIILRIVRIEREKELIIKIIVKIKQNNYISHQIKFSRNIF